ncbi:L-threonylcarbamoyladenylate synthase [Nocardioides sp. Bht2]|uniref:L-threonylcarbamoyladenylate synthase n=1 Tax=Nocardioides sp. Bht2 TaxID=3392297 RepID=UPI0039B6C217
MSIVKLSTAQPDDLDAAITTATGVIRRGELVVMPTDTVYGIAADAFNPEAVEALLAAKGRGREMPPPVLVAAAATLSALATDVPDWARALVEEFWPGPLTLVCHQQPSLRWDLGETRGTVAVRMPDDEVALALIDRTGPLAVSSANSTGQPAATDADRAEQMLGESVAVYLDAGPTAGAEPSTIIDVTGDAPRVLRQGALPIEEINRVLAPFEVRA